MNSLPQPDDLGAIVENLDFSLELPVGIPQLDQASFDLSVLPAKINDVSFSPMIGGLFLGVTTFLNEKRTLGLGELFAASPYQPLSTHPENLFCGLIHQGHFSIFPNRQDSGGESS